MKPIRDRAVYLVESKLNMKIGAFILYIGQRTFLDAKESIESQVDFLKVVKNVSPVNKAINYCFKRAEQEKLDHFLIFGADTIQKPDAIAIYKKHISENLWCVRGKLEDYYRETGGYVNHFYNAKAMKGIRVKEDDSMYDHNIYKLMEEKNYRDLITKEVTGVHHPIWSVKEAFEKHLHSGKRYDKKYREKFYKQVYDKFLENPCDVNFASLIGFGLGIKSQSKEVLTTRESDYWKWYKILFNCDELLKWHD